jgi:hypothetical protein
VIRRRKEGRAIPTDSTPVATSGEAGEEGGGAVAALVGTFALLALLVYEPTLFPGADAGHYMVLGESLRNGLGFRDIQLPGSPLHAKFPPGYPLILAVSGWFGGLQLFKAVSLAFGAGAVWLTYRIARSFTGRGAAIVATGLFAISPVLLDFSHRVLSEAAFTFLLLSVIGVTLPDRKVGAMALVAGAAAFLTRTAGLAVLLALVVWTLMNRDVRRSAVAIIVSAACVAGWAAYQHVAQPTHPGYLQQLVQENPYAPAAGTLGLADFPARAARNLWRYVSSEFPGSFGFPTRSRGTITSTALAGVFMSSLVLAGWLRSAVTRLRLAHLVVALYMGLISLWPPVWTDRRFLLPVLPLLVVFGVVGAAGAVRRVDERVGSGIVGLAAAGIAAVALISSGLVAPPRIACQFSYRSGHPCDRPEYREFYSMGRWAADNTPEGSVIANRSPATFFLFSRRQGDLYPYSTDPSAVLRGLEEMGADYVVVDRLSATTDMYLIPAVAAYLDRFEVVHALGGEQGTVLLRMLPVPRTASLSGGP